VGEILGRSKDALYLREPLTQTHLKRNEKHVLIDIRTGKDGADYCLSMAHAFGGLPFFPKGIVKYPEQWALIYRRRKRPVIKEVNPLILEYALERYQPIVIYITRHPAAVALSWVKLGWNDDLLGQLHSISKRLIKDLPAKWCNDTSSAGDMWYMHGLLQGIIYKLSMQWLADYSNATIVRYEDICADPPSTFRSLYHKTHLTWSGNLDEIVNAYSGEISTDSDPYSTRRVSHMMAWAWRSKISKEALTEIHNGFRIYEHEHYATEADWVL